MSFASGISKSVIICEESTWGTAPATGSTSAKFLPRVSLDLSLTRDSFASSRINQHAQVGESRSGTDKVSAKFADECASGSHTEIYESILRGSFVAGVTNTAAVISASATGNKLVRSTGSWITLGFKIGDVVDITGFTSPATANNGRGMVMSLTTTDMVISGVTLTTKAEGDSVTVAVAGKKLGIPATVAARSDRSFTIEQFYSDIGVSRLATGCKFGSAAVSIQPDAIATVEFSVEGKDMKTDSVAYFTAPQAATASSVMAGNKAFLMVDGSPAVAVTGLDFEIKGNLEPATVVGNLQSDNTRPSAAIFQGRIEVSGTLTAYFESDALFTKFRDDTDITLAFWMKGDSGKDLIYKMGRVRLGSATPNDAATGGLTQELSFNALYRENASGTAYDDSCIVIQEITA